MNWKIEKLGNYCDKIGSGATPKGGSLVYVDSGTALIRSQNVYNLSFDYEGLAFIKEDAAKKLDSVSVIEDDVLLNITGDSVARTCLVPNNVLPARVNQHVAIIRSQKNRLLPKYLSYYLASPYMQAHMLNLAVGKGASRNALTKDMIASFPIPIPNIEIQQRIVDILDPVINLIENNQQQIKLLEEAARRLYKEWFVDLHFSGHEQTKIVDSVPDGWRSCNIEDLISYEIGGGWGEDTPTNNCIEEAYVIRGTDLYSVKQGRFEDIPCRFHSKSNLNSRRLSDGDIIFEVSGGSKNTGAGRSLLIRTEILNLLKSPVMCASFCKLIRLKDKQLSQYFYDYLQYCKNSGITEKYDLRSASSIVNYRWKDFLKQEKILMPPNEILKKYSDFAEANYHKMMNCALQINLLQNARDRLLPKLMNGEIEI